MENVIFDNAIIRVIDNRTINGTAIVYYDGTPNTEFKLPNGTYERMVRGCADDLLNDDIIATFDHKQQNLLGRTPNTLRLFATDKGIDFQLELPETQQGNDAYQLIKRGDIKGCSFTGSYGKVSYTNEGKKKICNVERLGCLQEISVNVFPCYKGATIRRGEVLDLEYKIQLAQQQIKLLREKLKS